jgi:hypothetical protein
MVRRLIRMKVLDAARLLGHLVVIVDGTGLLCFHRRHCDHCLVQKHAKTTLYLHNVLEAKLLGPAGVVLSVGSEFIENTDAAAARGQGAERIKQDCELKAFSRLAPKIKQAFPQARLVLAGDSLFACGRVLDECFRQDWEFVLTFKEGHLPSLWQEYESLLPLCPRHRLERNSAEGIQQVYRWGEGAALRGQRPAALAVTRPGVPGNQRRRRGDPVRVVDPSAGERDQRGRDRPERRARALEDRERGVQPPEEQRLEPGSTFTAPTRRSGRPITTCCRSPFIVQLLERGSLLRRLAQQQGKRTAVAWLGSLKNIARRLLESLRQRRWPEASYNTTLAAAIHIGLEDTS